MKTMRYMLMAVAMAASMAAQAQTAIGRTALGSGEPGKTGVENATQVDNNIYHAPQYLPGYPTAAVIYPRAVEVNCIKEPSGRSVCEPYQWTPALGRGEYLYFTPIQVAAVTPPPPAISPPPPSPQRFNPPPARRDRN